MIILRNVVKSDLEDLYELSQKVYFINLPRDKKIIEKKISQSLKSFEKPDPVLANNYYIFVAEDLTKNKVIGVSMIHAQHGTEEEPHFYLSVTHENKYSSTINTGFVHGKLKLGLDTNGPTEIGGLVVDPEYRNTGTKLGKQLSFVRFLYMGLYPNRFKPEVHSELMPPFDNKGRAPLWEAIGRRFLNMDYYEADILSRNNKEFILSLFPSENIYMTLLPLEARNAIGKVGTDTLPVKKMLESIGFEYTSEVDPFDGGPHYRCLLKNIKPIKNLFSGSFVPTDKNENMKRYLIHINNSNFQFYSFMAFAEVKNDVLYIEKTNELTIAKDSEVRAICLN